MNSYDVAEELATRLNAITGLRSHPWPQASVAPPVALVMMPTLVTYDQTFARGGDRYQQDVVVIVGLSNLRSSYEQLSAYLNGSGSSSVKAALDGSDYDNCDSVRVETAETGTYTTANVVYLAATFTLDVVGSGS